MEPSRARCRHRLFPHPTPPQTKEAEVKFLKKLQTKAEAGGFKHLDYDKHQGAWCVQMEHF